jgi:hypothetical protein
MVGGGKLSANQAGRARPENQEKSKTGRNKEKSFGKTSHGHVKMDGVKNAPRSSVL